MSGRVLAVRRAERQHAQEHHFEAATGVRRQRQVAAPDQAHLVIELHVFGRQGLSQRQHAITVAMAVVDALRQRLGNGHTVQHVEDFRKHAAPIRTLLGQVAHGLQQRAGIAVDQRGEHVVDLAVIQRAEHGPHVSGQHLALTKSDSLIGQAHGVAHRTVGCAAQQPERVVFERNVFSAQHVGQVLDHTLRRHVLQRELQAARQDGGRQLLRVGGGEDELDVGRRLFQRLEQGVERVAGEHVHFVDQVDLEAPTARRVLHVVQQLASVFDLGAARGVDLDQVDETAFVDLPAHRTFAAGRGSDTGFTVQAFGDDPRDGGLADPARASE